MKRSFKWLLSLCLLTMSVIVTAKTPTEQFNEAMNLANSLRNTIHSDGNVVKITKSRGETVTFDPAVVFKSQPGGYTNNPPQTNYGSDANTMKNAAETAITENTTGGDQAVGKMVVDNFRTRPVFKISQNDDFIVKGNRVINSSQNIVKGESSNAINCEEKIEEYRSTEHCSTIFERKVCDEEIRTVTRVCEQVPKVTITTKDELHPHCRRLMLRYGYRTRCQSGERALLYHDFTPGSEDDIHLCDRPAREEEHECYLGYFVCGCHFKKNWRNDHENVWGQGVVPKNMQGYLRIEKVYRGKMEGTIFNDTTGEVVAEGFFSENQRIQLPISQTHDQVFRFKPKGDYNQSGRIHNLHYHDCLGIVVFYVERIKRLKEAQIIWEESCRDI